LCCSNRSGFLVICFWFAAGLLLCGQEPDRTPDLPEGDPQEFYLKALSEIRAGRTDSALRTLQAALQLHPDSHVVKRLLAAQLFEAGAYPEANTYYESFAREDSGNAEAWLKLAEIASFRQQYDRTIPLLRHLLDIDSANLGGLVLLGETLTRMNDTAAVAVYEKAHRLLPGNQQVSYALANWHIQLGRPGYAVPLCVQVLEKDTTNIRFLKLLGFAAYKLNDYTAAAEHFREAIALGDSSAFSFKYAGIARYLDVSFPEAIRFLTVASRLDSTDAEVHFFLGTSLGTTTRKKEAMFHLEKSLDLIKPDPAVIARIYSEQGNIMRLETEYEKAYSFYQKAWQADTTNPMAVYYMASILDNSLQRSREALADYSLFLEVLDRMPADALGKNSQIPTIRGIVVDRIELLREELFFRDGFD